MEQDSSKELKPPLKEASESETQTRVNGQTPIIRTATQEQFEKANRKTKTLHAGLFRRLAK